MDYRTNPYSVSMCYRARCILQAPEKSEISEIARHSVAIMYSKLSRHAPYCKQGAREVSRAEGLWCKHRGHNTRTQSFHGVYTVHTEGPKAQSPCAQQGAGSLRVVHIQGLEYTQGLSGWCTFKVLSTHRVSQGGAHTGWCTQVGAHRVSLGGAHKGWCTQGGAHRVSQGVAHTGWCTHRVHIAGAHTQDYVPELEIGVL
eukprot:scaffold43671_cov23-Tisochrysis_lutea.AAC.1